MRTKRLICLVLGLMLVFSGITVVAADETEMEAVQAEAVQATSHRDEAVSLLIQFEVIGSEDAQNLDEKITKAQFAKLLTGVINLRSFAGHHVEMKDVEADNAYAPYIEAMVDMRVFTVDVNRRFYPITNISESEALMAFVKLLGYTVIANNYGSGTSGVQKLASRLGWLADLDFANGHDHSGNHILTGGDALELCYNVMNSDYYYETIVGNRTSYTYEKDHTVLCEFYKMTMGKGRVIQNKKTSLVEPVGSAENSVRIDDKLYYVGNTNAETLLGYEVDFWYDGDMNLKHITPAVTNRVMTISAKNLDESTTREVIYYIKNNRLTSVRINQVDAIYNGVAKYDYQAADLLINAGNLTLLDADGNGSYDVIFINEYEPVVVRSVDGENQRVVDSVLQTMKDLDPNNYDYLDLYVYDAAMDTLIPATLEEIAVGDVLQFYLSAEGSVLSVVKGGHSFTGTVTQVPNESDEVYIDGNLYDVSYKFAQAQAAGLLGIEKLEPGKSGTFYLDMYGEVIYTDLNGKIYAYGYASKFALENAGFSTVAKIRVYTVANEWRVFKIADRVRLNGTITKNPADVQAALLRDIGDGQMAVIPQLIRYTANGGEITYLDTYVDMTGFSDYEGHDENHFTKDASLVSARYKSSTKAFSMRYVGKTSATYVFNIPTEALDSNYVLDEDQVYCYGVGAFVNDSAYNIDIYDADQYNVAQVIVFTGSLKTNFEQRLFFVNELNTTISSDGETYIEMVGYFEGSRQIRFCVDNQEVLDGVRTGDVLVVSFRPDGQVLNLERVLTIKRQADDPDDILTPDEFSEKIVGSGSVVEVAAIGVYVAEMYDINYGGTNFLAKTPTGMRSFNYNSVTVMRYDSRTKLYTPAAISDAQCARFSDKGSTLFIHTRIGEGRDIVIFD